MIVIDYQNNLYCKNCAAKQAITYKNLTHFKNTMAKFNADHQHCHQLNDLITLEQIAELSATPYTSLRSYANKLDLPEPIKIGTKKYYTKKQILDYLKTNNLKLKLAKARNEYYLSKERPPRDDILKPSEKKELPMINKFLRGGFDAKQKQQQNQLKLEASRNNQAKTIVLRCFEDVHGNVTRQFI